VRALRRNRRDLRRVAKQKKYYETPKLKGPGSLETFLEAEPSAELRKAALELAEHYRKTRKADEGK